MVVKVLNLYAGIGGNRKLWNGVKVVAVEIDKKIAAIYQDFFPDDEVVVADAHEFLLENFEEFDFIWSSPPCQTHSRARYWGYGKKRPTYPDLSLYEEIIFLRHHFEGKWVVENVIPYYEALIKPTAQIDRHLFWSNYSIPSMNHDFEYPKDYPKQLENLYGFDLSKYKLTNKEKQKILRNVVHPEIGKHVFESAFTQKQINSFLSI